MERTSFPEKVTIWCAISSHGILGPYFYEENGSRVTVNGVSYVDLLENKFYPDAGRSSTAHCSTSSDPHIIHNMDPTFAMNACRSVKKRCRNVIAAGGGQFEHLN